MTMTTTVKTVTCLCGDVYQFSDKDVRLAADGETKCVALACGFVPITDVTIFEKEVYLVDETSTFPGYGYDRSGFADLEIMLKTAYNRIQVGTKLDYQQTVRLLKDIRLKAGKLEKLYKLELE